MYKFVIFILIFLIQSCVFVKGKTDVYIPLPKMTILAGDTMTFTTSNGVGPYTANTYSVGTLFGR